MKTNQPSIQLAQPTIDELKAEAWEMYNDGDTYPELFDCIEACMIQIKAKYRNTEPVRMYGRSFTPEEAMKTDIRMNEFTKQDFFKMLDKHISI